MIEEGNNFLLDDPIVLSKDTDILGHDNIVNRLKGAIKVHKNEKSSCVIGLEGEWGTWKTSILNTLEEDIKNCRELEGFIVFNYSPWLYGSDQDLYTKFFEEFWIFLEKNKFFDKDFNIKNLKNYSKAISGIDSLSNNFLSISIQWLLSLFHLVNDKIIVLFLIFWIVYLVVMFIFLFKSFSRDLSLFWTTEFIFKDLLFILLTLMVAAWFTSIIKFYSDSWDDLTNTLKNNIDDSLKKNKKKIIFIIDDIDRLPKDKISIIMQLVKSIANFNNVIYILSYDKKIVENALMEEYNSDHYLDKIVQVKVPIPIVSNLTILEFALIQLKNFIQNNTTRYSMDNTESTQDDLKDLLPFLEDLKTIRDVKRFINMFQVDFEMFHTNLISSNSCKITKKRLEFDFNEFVIIEFVKFVNREFYDRIYNNIWDILSTDRWILGEDKDARQVLQHRLDKFLEQNPFKFAWALITKLFPINQYWKTEKSTISISNKKRFKSYFVLEKKPALWEAIFHAVLEFILDPVSQSNNIVKEVLSEQWWSFFDKLDEVIQKADGNKWEGIDLIEIFSFLISNHNIIQIEDIGLFNPSPWQHISLKIHNLFEKLSDDIPLYLSSFEKLLSVKWWLFFMLYYASVSILYNPDLDWWISAPYLVEKNRKFKEKIGDENIKKLEKKLKAKIKNIIDTRQLLKEAGWENILKYAMILGWKTRDNLITDLKNNNAIKQFFENKVVSHLRHNKNTSHNVSNEVKKSASYYFSNSKLKEILNEYYKTIEPEIYNDIKSILFPWSI